MKSRPKRRSIGGLIAIVGFFACMAAASLFSGLFSGGSTKQTLSLQPQKKHPASLSFDLRPTSPRAGDFSPRLILDTSGFSQINAFVRPWSGRESLDEISKAWKSIGYRSIETIDQTIKPQIRDAQRSVFLLVDKAMLYNSEGQPQKALEVLEEAKAHCRKNPELAKLALYTLIYLQGVSAIRLGENENCVMCRGESSCILPISEAATHRVARGSQLAIERFTEYLDVFPNDIEVRWLLNLAHMTLGQYPDKVDPRYLITLDRYMHPEFDIGKFRDVGHLTGVNRFSQAGSSIMDDFDNDGRFDLVVTAYDPTESIVYYHNTGDGTFEDRTSSAGIQDQLGGLFCTQVDYDNDGDLDIWISRGAWLKQPIRPSLLSNNGDGTFKDVTEAAGLSAPVNSNSASWADYDNDGHLDLFVCCEQQPSKLYHNNGNGTFEEVATKAGFWAESQPWNKGAAWIDYDNDDYSDLYLNHLSGFGRLYHNNKNGTFSEVTGTPVMSAGAQNGFSCWAWDYNNDGFLDLFATSYRFSTDEIIRGLMDGKQAGSTSKLLLNHNGERFEDVSIPAGLNLAYGCMGSNFADFDNDGFLDFYLV